MLTDLCLLYLTYYATGCLKLRLSSGMLRRVVWQKFIDVSVVLAASIIPLMLEAASTSETLVNLYQTRWRNIPKDSHL
jgi:hypothetical protein